jgi:glycosyltransferase involved in cell wall biosynthesis
VARVVHLTSVHRPADTRIFAKECRTLARAGHEVTLVAPAPRSEVVDGIAISAVSEPRGRLERMTRTVAAVRRRALELDADLYHFHDPELMPLGVELRRRGRAVIYDVHEDAPRAMLTKSWIPPWARRPVARAVELGEPFAARGLSAIVAATPTIGARFERLGPPTVVVNNFPVIGDLSGPAGDGAPREAATCYVGDINRLRGAIEMVDAAGLAGVPLLLAGTFSEPGLRDEAAARPGWASVQELGQLTRPEVAAMFARARAGLVVLHPAPNNVNGRPNKLFEYMSAGLAVIASDFPLWREIVDAAGCGLCVDPLDPSAIAGAMRRLGNDGDEAAAMGARGREAVRDRFNWDSEAPKLVELYARLT